MTKRDDHRGHPAVRPLALAATIAAGSAAYGEAVRFDAPGDGIYIDRYGSPAYNMTTAFGETGPSSAEFRADSSYDPFSYLRVEYTHSITGIQVWGAPDPSHSGNRSFARTFQRGDLIDAASQQPGEWQNGATVTDVLAQFDYDANDDIVLIDYESYGFTTPGTSVAYVGTRFMLDGAYHYGWIGLTLRTFNPFGLMPEDILIPARVFAWGYETEAGVGIGAGVPGPASIGVLAFGAAGALKRRKRAA